MTDDSRATNDDFGQDAASSQRRRWRWVRIPARLVMFAALVAALTVLSGGPVARPALAATCYSVTTSVIPAEGGGVIVMPPPNCPNPGESTKYTEGTLVTAAATAEDNWAFVAWVDSYETGSQVLVDQDIHFGAKFAPATFDGIPVADISVDTGEFQYFYFDLAAGATHLRIYIEGSIGDVDLFVTQGSLPTLFSYDCGPQISGSTEECNFGTIGTPPESGRYWIMLRGFAAGTTTLTATACWPIDLDIYPAGEQVDQPPYTCLDGYLGGSEVTLDPVLDGSEPVFLTWEGDVQTSERPLTFVPAGPTQLTALFGFVVESPDFDVVLQPGVPQAFYYSTSIGSQFLLDVAFGLQAGASFSYEMFILELPAGQHVPLCAGTSASATPGCTYVGDAQAIVLVLRSAGGATVNVATAGGLCVPAADLEIVPAGSGRVRYTPAPNCGDQLWLLGTEITAEAIPFEGFEFVGWTNSATHSIDAIDPVSRFKVFPAGGPPALPVAIMGRKVQAGTVIAPLDLPAGQSRYFYIDVPSGRSSLSVSLDSDVALSAGLITSYEAPPTSENTVCLDSTGPLECVAANPDGGRWWAAVGSNTAFSGATFAMTFDPICHELEFSGLPDVVFEFPQATPAPNCGDRQYLPGTEVTVKLPGHIESYESVFAYRESVGGGALLGGVDDTFTFELNGHEHFLLSYSIPAYPGVSYENVSVGPEHAYRIFHVDVPPGTTSLSVDSSSTALGSRELISPGGYLICDTSDVNVPCEVSSPEPGRWTIWFISLASADVSLEVNLLPAPNSTVDYLSVSRWQIGSALPDLLVNGFGFTPESVVFIEGLGPMITTFDDERRLRVSLSAGQVGNVPRVMDVSVIEDGQADSNSVPLFIVSSSDVDCDGLTTSADALAELRHLAGLPLEGSCPRDPDADGDADLADVLWIRKEIAELVTPIPPLGG